ncbi:MAG: lipopolysaccharide assembly protein LapA domain-containing protein [Candidatus Zixiibacteriota bacterium]|jgi:uncharacterized membrane protein YciS (DUF1049 family)
MWAVRAVLIAIVVILVVAFAYNNFKPEQTVDVYLQPIFSNYVDVPLVTVVFWSFVSGLVVSLLMFITTYIKLSVQVHGARKRVRSLENEVAILRNRPIEESADLLKGADDEETQVPSPFEER